MELQKELVTLKMEMSQGLSNLPHYDQLLQKHVTKIQLSQQNGERMHTHCLSASFKNEFIGLCLEYVRISFLYETDDAKYYSIIVDATPDSSHVRQTIFIIRYFTRASSISCSRTIQA